MYRVFIDCANGYAIPTDASFGSIVLAIQLADCHSNASGNTLNASVWKNGNCYYSTDRNMPIDGCIDVNGEQF